MLTLTFSLMMFFLNVLLFQGEVRSKLQNWGRLWRVVFANKDVI